MMTSPETCFLCFVQHAWRAVLKMFVRLQYFGLKQVTEPRQKLCKSYLQRREIEKRREKEPFTT